MDIRPYSVKMVRAIVTIKDSGIGMSEEEIAKLFKEFVRIKNRKKTKNISGSGLGLSIVKKITEIYHGEYFSNQRT